MKITVIMQPLKSAFRKQHNENSVVDPVPWFLVGGTTANSIPSAYIDRPGPKQYELQNTIRDLL